MYPHTELPWQPYIPIIIQENPISQITRMKRAELVSLVVIWNDINFNFSGDNELFSSAKILTAFQLRETSMISALSLLE